MVIDCKPLRICHISILLYGKYTVKDWKDPQKELALKFIYTTNNGRIQQLISNQSTN